MDELFRASLDVKAVLHHGNPASFLIIKPVNAATQVALTGLRVTLKSTQQ